MGAAGTVLPPGGGGTALTPDAVGGAGTDLAPAFEGGGGAARAEEPFVEGIAGFAPGLGPTDGGLVPIFGGGALPKSTKRLEFALKTL